MDKPKREIVRKTKTEVREEQSDDEEYCLPFPLLTPF